MDIRKEARGNDGPDLLKEFGWKKLSNDGRI